MLSRLGPVMFLHSRGRRVAVALGVGMWTAGFLIQNPPLAVLASAAATPAVLAVRARPVAGGMLALSASVLTVLGAAPFGSVDLVALFAVVGVTMGRVMPSPWPSALIAVGFAVSSAWREGFTWEKAALCACVFGTFSLFGRVVRARAEHAEAAIAASIALARQDPVAEAARAVTEERERLADEATIALRDAVEGMRTAVRTARDRLAEADLATVRQRGAAAVDDLRELLIVLRAEPPPEPAGASRPARPVWLDDALTAAGVAVAIGLLAASHDSWAPEERWQVTPTVWALYAAVLLAIAVRRSSPAIAAGILAAASGVMLLDPPREPYSLLPTAGAYLLVTWSTVREGTRRAWSAEAVLVLAGLAVGAQYGEHGLGFTAILFTMAALAAIAWGERDRLLREATERVEVLQEQLNRSVSDALRAERVRAARRLHDTASHAVGVMLLHTGAAMALRVKDPAAARRALDTVATQADSVLNRLDAGVGLLDEGVSRSTDADVARLIERMRAAGMAVSTALAPMPTRPGAARIVFRVIQEGLANAGRHAPGSDVVVETARSEHGYRVSVTDDGRRTSPAAPGSGFGLVGLHERVRAAGGRFHAGRHGEGYRIEAVLPDTR